jgi:hypothetical protein
LRAGAGAARAAVDAVIHAAAKVAGIGYEALGAAALAAGDAATAQDAAEQVKKVSGLAIDTKNSHRLATT